MLFGGSAHAGVLSPGVISSFHAGGFSYEVRAREIQRIGPDGAVTTTKLPDATDAMIRYFRPTVDEIDDIDSKIGPVVREGNRIWFAIDFYSGEGSAGIGGIGVVDLNTMRLGLLRHPALVDCAASGLSVSAQEFVVDTYYFGEGSFGSCHGRVAIDRSSLRAWTCGDKPGSKNPDGTLPCDPARRTEIKEKVPSPPRHLTQPDLDRAMFAETDFEQGWFADAVKNSQVLLDQHCTIGPSATPDDKTITPSPAICTVPSVDGHGIVNATWGGGVSHYACEPNGFFAVSVGTGAGIDATVRATGLQRLYRITNAWQGTPVATAGIKWSRHWQVNPVDLFSILVLEEVEPMTVHCRNPYEFASGPAIRSTKWWLRVMRLNQDYRPKIADMAPFFPENAYAGLLRFVVAASGNVRAEPDAKSAILGKLPIATQVKIQKTSNQWVLVTTLGGKMKGLTGWVESESLVVQQPTSEWLFEKYNRTPEDQVDVRRLWAERAVALDPSDRWAQRLLDETNLGSGSAPR